MRHNTAVALCSVFFAAAVTDSRSAYAFPPPPIANGGFETGDLSLWATTISTGVSTTVKHSGTYAAKLGPTPAGNTSVAISQDDYDIPDNGIIGFWYDLICGAQSTDSLTVTLENLATVTTVTALQATCANGTTGWRQAFIDVSSVGGYNWNSASVRLEFTMTAPSGSNTVAYVDDVVGTGIRNGTFERSIAFSGVSWTTSGTVSQSALGMGHSGSYAGMLGSTSPTTDSSVSQTFLSSPGTLVFWYDMTCTDSVVFDWFTVTITDNTTNVTYTPVQPKCSSAGWTQVQFDLGPTAGHYVTITMLNHDDNHVNDASWTLVDDVNIVPNASPHSRCGWLWSGGPGGNPAGYSSFESNAAWFNVIHPAWYQINSNAANVDELAGVDDTTMVGSAKQNNVKIIPLVFAGDQTTAQYVTTMLGDNAKMAQHITNLVGIAAVHGYYGLDLDYEHIPDSSRSQFATFVSNLSQRMHASGKTVSIVVPGMTASSATSAYDYTNVGPNLDQLHVMGYDFHFDPSNYCSDFGTFAHSGPIAPLGWIQSVAAHIMNTGLQSKFVLGIPNYGTNSAGLDCYGTDCPAYCSGSIAYVTDHFQPCPATDPSHPDCGGWTPSLTCCPFDTGNWASGRTPNCATSGSAPLFFEDVTSQSEKVSAAKSASLGGVTYFTVGKEPTGFFDMVKQYYP